MVMEMENTKQHYQYAKNTCMILKYASLICYVKN